MKKKYLFSFLLGALFASVSLANPGGHYTVEQIFGYTPDQQLTATNHNGGTTRFSIKFRNNLDTTLTDEAGRAYIANYGLRLYALPARNETFPKHGGGTYTSPGSMPVATNALALNMGMAVIFENIFVECLAKNAQFQSGIGGQLGDGLVQSTPDLPNGAKVINVMLPIQAGSYQNPTPGWPLLASTYVQNFASGTTGKMYFFDQDPVIPEPFSSFRNELNGEDGFPFIKLPFVEDYQPYCVSRYQPIDMSNSMFRVPFKNEAGHQSYFVYGGNDVYVALHFHTPCTVDTLGNEASKNVDKQLYREFVKYYPSDLFTKYPAIADRYTRNNTGVTFTYSTYSNKETVRHIATRYNLSHLSLGASNGDAIDQYDPNAGMFPGDSADYCFYRNFGIDGTSNSNIEENYQGGKTPSGPSTMAADQLGVAPYTLPAFRLNYFRNDIIIKCTDPTGTLAPVQARLRTKDAQDRYLVDYRTVQGDANGIITFEDVDPTQQYQLTVCGVVDEETGTGNCYGYAYAIVDFDHVTTEEETPGAAPVAGEPATNDSGDMLFNDILVKVELERGTPTAVEEPQVASTQVRGCRGGIEVVATQNCTLPVYDMMGRLVRTLQVTQGESLFDGFAQGLYVVGGKKVVVR